MQTYIHISLTDSRLKIITSIFMTSGNNHDKKKSKQDNCDDKVWQ